MKVKYFLAMLLSLLLSAGIAAQVMHSTGETAMQSDGNSEEDNELSSRSRASRSNSFDISDFSKIVYSWKFNYATQDSQGWTFGSKTYWRSGGLNVNDSIMSPKIDLSEFNTPVLIRCYGGAYSPWDDSGLYVSPDGSRWISLMATSSYNSNGCVLPKWAKYIKIRREFDVSGLYIADVSSKEEWKIVCGTGAAKAPNTMLTVDLNRDGKLDGYDTGILYESSGFGYVKYQQDYFGKYDILYDFRDIYLTSHPDIIVAIKDSNRQISTFRVNLPDFTLIDSRQITDYDTGGTLYPMDADNDGVVDEFINTVKNVVYTIDEDGILREGMLHVVSLSDMQIQEQESEGRSFVAWDYSMLSPGYVGSQMFGRDGASVGVSLDGGQFKSIDINGDGLTDYVNFNSGKVYFNLGNGKYYTDSFDGRIHFADFDGDGREDYILYNGSKLTLNLVDQEGKTSSKDIISGYTCTNIWTRDVDNDGDPDIVLSLESSQKFIVVLENTGKGNFRRRENVPKDVTGKFISCCDYDNDGKYEVLTSTHQAYKLNGYLLDTTPVEIAAESDVLFMNPGDGMMYGQSKDQYGDFEGCISLDVASNQRPLPPATAPSVISESSTGLVKISWEAGSDKETPATDLTYSLRVGTSEGLEDVVPAFASPDGVRYSATEGNCSGKKNIIIDSSKWPAGTYYISVQTVDGNYLGSSFSKCALFEKKEQAVDFELNYTNNLGIYQSLELRLPVAPKSDDTYNWDFDGAQVLSRSDDGRSIMLSFDTPGEKTISLSIMSADGVATRTVSRSVDVFPTSIKHGDIMNVYGESGDGTSCFSAVFDMDEDGVVEGYAGRWRSKFMKGDENGIYRPIDKMFNSHSLVGYFRDYKVATIDLNGDGICDIVSPDFQNRYSKLIYGYNYGDLDMDFESVSGGGLDNLYIEEWLDFDNDGSYDVYGRNQIWRNDGTYKDFKSNILPLSKALFADCNGDGLIDAISDNTIYYNNGDFTFNSTRTLDGIKYGEIIAVADFDNNGENDFLFFNGTLQILWDDNEISDLGANFTPYSKTIRDINNDGFPDIVSSYGLVLMQGGRTWKVYDKAELEKDIDNVPYKYFGKCFVGSNGKTYTISDNYQDGYYNTTFPDVLRVDVPNEAPKAPSNLRHTQNDRFVVLEWNHSVDKETPAAQMRYNLSVKRKGAEGEGAYLFSPANSAKDGIPVPSNKPLIKGNVFSIPVANIPVGAYEVKVQGVDAFNMQSDFSEMYEMNVTESATVEMQATGEVNVPVDVKVLVNYDSQIDYDGGRELAYASGVHTVVWTEPGTKTIKIGDSQAQIFIQSAPDGSFSLPETARVGDRINVSGLLMDEGRWSVVERVWNGEWEDKEVNLLEDNKYFDFEILSSQSAVVIPKKYGSQSMTHFVSSRFSTQSYTSSSYCPYDEFIAGVSDRIDTPSAPEIDYVTADAATGKYKIQWKNPSKFRENAAGINVYKEGAVAGKYILLDKLPLTAQEYVDRTSNPDVMASRYVLTYELAHGESRDSKAHQPVHVMINRGAGSSWNLIWGKYEGAVIPQYRILRGPSPENMTVIAEVSGNLTSYTDFTAPTSGELYYAVESVLQPEGVQSAPRSRAITVTTYPRSNVIAAAGGSVTFAQSIKILSDADFAIDCSADSNKGLQLRAVIDPTNATFGRVNWIVTSGEELVTIDQSGLVVATGLGNGQAVVRAQSIDGSGIYDEITVSVNGVSGIAAPRVDADDFVINVYLSPAMSQLNISGLTDGSDVSVFSVGGSMTYHATDWTGGETAEIDCSRWAQGVYIVRVCDPTSGSIAVKKVIKQ